MSVPVSEIWRRYESAGPITDAYMVAEDPVTCLMGPYRSGKTTANFIRGLLQSTCVPPSPQDGIRYASGVVIRDTYRNLDLTTIPTFKTHFPDEWGTWRGGGGGAAFSNIEFDLEDGTKLQQQIIFAAIGDTNVKTFCDGFEATWGFINGLDALPADIITYLFGRLGQYPPPMHRGADWNKFKPAFRKLGSDMNAPDIDNWTYGNEENKTPGFVECVPEGWKLFRQPSGLSPNAENIKIVGREYYETLEKTNRAKKWFINRFIKNQFGFSQEGEAVYTNYDDERHVAKDFLEFNSSRKLLLGLDAGRNPAALAGQRDFMGRLRILREFQPGRMGARKFAPLLSHWLAENFPDAEIDAIADPASADPTQDSGKGDDEAQVWLETVSELANIPIRPAPTNLMGPRYDAVDKLLTESFDGQPSYQMDPRCVKLRRGKNSGYRYGKTRRHGDEVLTNDVVDNEYTHLQDAEQYLALGSCDYQELIGRGKRRQTKTRVVTMDDAG